MSWWNDEESSTEEEALYSDDEDVKSPAIKENKPAPKSKPIIFDSDSDDEKGRVVLPEKEKRYQAIEESVKNLRASMKAEDWNVIHDKWSSLVEVVSKSRKVIDKDGYPGAFIQCVVLLETLIKQNSGKRKTMKPTQASFFGKVEGKVKKYLTSQGESPNFAKLQSAIEEYKKNPTASEEVPEPKTEPVEKTEKPKEPAKPSDAWFDNDDEEEEEEGKEGDEEGDEDDEDDEMWDDDELSSDNEEDEDFLKKDISYWYTFDEVVPSKRETRVRERKAKPQPQEQEADKDAKEEKKEKKQEKPQEKIDWTPEKVDKEIYELLRKRGAKNYVPKEHITTFKTLISNIPELNKKLTVTFHLINAQLDTNMNATTLMSLSMWKQVYNEIANTLETLLNNNHITLCETTEEITSITQQPEPDTLKLPHNVSYGHLMFSIQRLNDEFLRSLQNTEAHSQDYLNRLAHEKDILLLLQYAEKYYEKKNKWESVAAIAFRELEYLYYKRSSEQGGIEEIKLANDDIDDDVEPDTAPVETTTAEDEKRIEEAASADERSDEIQIKVLKDVTPYTNLKETVSRLCNLVYRYSEDRYKRKAMLQQIYHLALHDMFFEARDLVLMTHLQEKILKAKIDTQVMFNRSMVQLGLAAFRKGRLEDANNCLQEIVANSKAKELLAQGIKTFNVIEKTNEQERQEKKRQVPFHQHINIDLIECVQLVAAMLLEIPNQAQFSSKRVISKHFRKVLDYHDRQIFTGPPENTRESIIVAAKALQQGNWKRCKDLIVNLEIWKLMPKYEEVIVLVTKLIQEQALKTYLFTYGQYYDSISIPQLATMFDLEAKVVHALVSKLIINEDLYASLDQTTSSIIIHGQDPSQLQHLSLTHAERVSILGESSELQDQKAAAKGWQVPTTQQAVNMPATGFDGKVKGYYPRGGRSGIYTPRSERQFSVASRGGTNTNTNNKKQRTNVGRTLR